MSKKQNKKQIGLILKLAVLRARPVRARGFSLTLFPYSYRNTAIQTSKSSQTRSSDPLDTERAADPSIAWARFMRRTDPIKPMNVGMYVGHLGSV